MKIPKIIAAAAISAALVLPGCASMTVDQTGYYTGTLDDIRIENYYKDFKRSNVTSNIYVAFVVSIASDDFPEGGSLEGICAPSDNSPWRVHATSAADWETIQIGDTVSGKYTIYENGDVYLNIDDVVTAN